ncbi:MAG: glycine--tRNA ligase subunit beta [Rhizobiaceae bacterium]|nr:glycine--tRNA ligase subunit beta [Rhizobiaceae bacterium]
MPDLLLELFSEEIPARMQRKAAGDLRAAVTNALVDAGLTYEGVKEYWTPRRLVLDVRGLSARSADIREERKGPRTDAPEKAVAGFLRGAGLESIDQAEIRNDPKKGDFYVAVIEKAGRDAAGIVSEVLPGIIKSFPWPKSMRWGAASSQAGALKWVRPLQSILCLFGPETEEMEIVPFEVSGIASGNLTRGHRFMAPDAFAVKHFDDYADKLEKAFVMLDAETRKETILAEARNLTFAQGYDLVDDPGLLEEVSGLVEWPVVLMGEFDEAFLDIPAEVIQLTIRENQKCFVVANGGGNEGESAPTLANRFILVSNIVPKDGGTEVSRGNAKVVNARLSDAKFFWESDLQQIASDEGFEPWIRKLDDVTFHKLLGSQGQRVERIVELAGELADVVGADPDLVKQAARLCKADLNSAMVYEFPEVQGLMGRYYAERADMPAPVAAAIQEHYSPLGPSDSVPSDPVSATVALADKLDTLIAFWAIDEKPTGSKDPYALRRAALGVNRICIEHNLNRLDILHFAMKTADKYWSNTDALVIASSLAEFLIDRLKVQLRDRGISHEVVDAVAHQGIMVPDSEKSPGMGNVRTIAIIERTADALDRFLKTEDGKNLLEGYKRAANILAAEEKKETRIADAVSSSLLTVDEETALNEAIDKAVSQAEEAVANQNFEAAMTALAGLREPVDAFFENVMVNDEDEKIRANRLALLTRIRNATATVADFGKISG